jgi:hypothetical protein
MSWKPIDLAPRDGSPIVVVFRSPLTGSVSASVAEWRAGAWERRGDADGPEITGDVAFAWSDLPEDLMP